MARRTAVHLSQILVCIARPSFADDMLEIEGAEALKPGRGPEDSQILEKSPFLGKWDYAKAPFCYRPTVWSKFQKLPFEIQYRFSDGLILNAHQLFYHAYGELVPADLRVRFESQSRELRAYTTEEGRARHYSYEEEFLLILRSAFETKNRKFEIRFALGFDPGEDRVALPLESVGFIEESSPLTCVLKCEGEGEASSQGKAVLEIHPRQGIDPVWYAFPTFFFDPREGRLVFHQDGQKISRLLKILNAYHLEAPVDREESNILGREFALSGHETIGTVCRVLREDPKSFDLKVLPSSQSVPRARRSTLLTIHQKDYGRAALSYQVKFPDALDPAKDVYVLHAGDWSRQILTALSTGLQAFLKHDKKLMLSKRRAMRQNDLVLFNHVGIQAVALHRLLGFLLPLTEAPQERDVAAFEKKLFTDVAKLIVRKNQPGGDFSAALHHLCGPKAVSFLSDWIRVFISRYFSDEISLYGAAGEVALPEYHYDFLKMIHTLIEFRALKTGGEGFLSTRRPILQHAVEASEPKRVDAPFISAKPVAADRVPQWLFLDWNAAEFLEALMPLRQEGIEVRFDGLPIEEIGEKGFQAAFQLESPPEQQPQRDAAARGLVEAGKLEVESAPQPAAGGRSLIPRTPTIDWFDLHPRFFLNGVEINAAQAQKLSKGGLLEWNGKLYVLKDRALPSLQRLERFWETLSLSKNKERSRSSDDSILRLPRNQTLELLLLRASGIPIQGNDAWTAICEFYDSLSSERPEFTLPETLKGDIKPYQRHGVAWIHDLYRLGLGGILADDMGLGKTLQTLAFLEKLRSQDEMGHVLVIVPTSLTYNWIAEGEKFAPELPLKIFQPKEKDLLKAFLSENRHAAIVCTYGLLVEHDEFFRQFAWNIHVYDEAQSLKNIASQRTYASRSVPARFKLCLTGTPLENHLGELFSLLDLVVPGALGTLEGFRKKFVNPREIAKEEVELLKLKVKPLVLRRHKSEILKELPPKIESRVALPFEEKQRKIYRDIALSWNEKVKSSVEQYGEAQSQMMMLTALLRLRQACSDPAALPQTKYALVPPKISLLIESLEEIVESGESALIFTQFLATYERIRGQLSEHKIPHFGIHGGLSNPQRQKALAGFKEHAGGAVLLMTLKTGGVGLNLTKASYVFHIEPWWNPAVENQATDRTHRMGQTNTVQVYRYLMQESVEEKIEILKKRKEDRFQALFGKSGVDEETASAPQNAATGLSRQDFEFLIRTEEKA